MENLIYFRKPHNYTYRKYAVGRGDDGLIRLYEIVEGKMVLDKVFYSYDHTFFKTMDDASLFLNAFIAANEMGYSEMARVYCMLVASQTNGNFFRRTGFYLPYNFDELSVNFIKNLALEENVPYL